MESNGNAGRGGAAAPNVRGDSTTDEDGTRATESTGEAGRRLGPVASMHSLCTSNLVTVMVPTFTRCMYLLSRAKASNWGAGLRHAPAAGEVAGARAAARQCSSSSKPVTTQGEWLIHASVAYQRRRSRTAWRKAVICPSTPMSMPTWAPASNTESCNDQYQSLGLARREDPPRSKKSPPPTHLWSPHRQQGRQALGASALMT